MTTLVEKVANPTTYDIQVVQEIVAESTKNVTQAMMLALMGGLQEKLSFKELAEKHINPKLDEDLSESDEKTRMVYHKLFAASQEHINQFSAQFLGATLLTIQMDTENTDAPRQFLGSFVISETKNTVEKLLDRAPESLEDQEIWK